MWGEVFKKQAQDRAFFIVYLRHVKKIRAAFWTASNRPQDEELKGRQNAKKRANQDTSPACSEAVQLFSLSISVQVRFRDHVSRF